MEGRKNNREPKNTKRWTYHGSKKLGGRWLSKSATSEITGGVGKTKEGAILPGRLRSNVRRGGDLKTREKC